ncbi:MAG: glycosyltransferase [Acidobacteria bacterium]|nr:glycosyltransferase [Acidobacteriota bacterium]
MFNPLDHPICLSSPLRLASTAWAEHIPFAMLVVELLRPATIVELGTFSGVSYCAFCQAVQELELNSRCYAVDTWEGDSQSGYFGAEVLDDLKRHHDPLYSQFSTLIQSTFDEALPQFADGTIDLLHIDGYHTYAAVRHDFDNWLPKMSRCGVMLFHDIEIREGDFGVWKLWAELREQYPHFEFQHEHGLGVLAVGESASSGLQPLLEAPEAQKEILRNLFFQLGQRFKLRLEGEHREKTLGWQIEDQENLLRALNTQLAQREEAIAWLSAQEKEKDDILQQRDEAIRWLQEELGLAQKAVKRLTKVNEALTAQAGENQQSLDALASLTVEKERLARALVVEQKKVASLKARLAHPTAQAEEQEAIICAREEAIAWLQTELAHAQKSNDRLASANELLKAQVIAKEQAKQTLARQLATKETQLQRLLNSFGGRLLNRYGAIKYRYLLPIYRLLHLLPAENSGNPQPPHALPALQPLSLESTAPEENIEDSQRLEALNTAAPAPLELPPPSRQPADFYESLTLLPQPNEEELSAIFNQRLSPRLARKPDVICFSIIDWEFRYQRPQQLMSQFAAQGHRVFYISTSRFLAATALPRIAVSQIKENIFEVQLAAEYIPEVYGRVIQGINQNALLASLEELRQTFHIDSALAYVMISSWGNLAFEARRLWKWRILYDCMDEWENFPGIKQPLLDMEINLVRECDLLVVSAQRLYDKWLAYERPMVLARNGVDVQFYTQEYRPNTLLPAIPHPLIGYYGAIADWFDVDLLVNAARQRPHYSFVLLGGVFEVDVSELEALPNVYLLGQQPYETMPQYLFHFDVCMIPFKINPITEATDPVKLYEYLSAGKPVVAVALAELEALRDYLYLAEDQQDFVVQLDLAVAENDAEVVTRRQRFAAQNTWEARYQQIEAGLIRITPRASIIIVTYNNLALNKLCLESLIRNTTYLNYEVIVVDNHSLDGTPAYLRYLAGCYSHLSIILNQENHGFARANNQGIASSTGEYIVLLNNDTIVPTGWLDRLLRHLKDPAVGLVGPVTNFVGNEARVEVPYQTWGEMQDFAHEYTWSHEGKVADIFMLAMFCVALRRDTLEEIGLLDEQFGIGMFEDDDYTQRVKAQGYRVICAADVFVHHFGQAAFKKLIASGDYDALFDENRQRYETKWKIKWIPHQNAPLKFETLAPPTPSSQTVEQADKRTAKKIG